MKHRLRIDELHLVVPAVGGKWHLILLATAASGHVMSDSFKD